MQNQLGEGHYLTMFYGALNIATRSLEYVNAGHCPPVLKHHPGTAETLGATRPVLGLVARQGTKSERIALHSGDCLLLYTDGITEASNSEGEEFGEERLTSLISSPGDLQAQHATVLKAVSQHSGGKLADDATLLLVAIR